VLASPRRTRRVVLLAITAVLAGLLLAQCRSVTDTVFGRSNAAAKAENCVQGCADAANDLKKAESKTHVANVKACGGNASCLAQEQARHEAAIQAINESRKRCQASCHHQGGGQGR
jgi:hypothetical protein